MTGFNENLMTEFVLHSRLFLSSDDVYTYNCSMEFGPGGVPGFARLNCTYFTRIDHMFGPEDLDYVVYSIRPD